MRAAIFSDTHGNLVALDAVLADLKAGGTSDLMIMAGDLALLGPRPAETVDRIRGLNCLVLRGNTDQYVVDNTGGAHDWAREQLGEERLCYLAGLPFAYSVQPAPGRELLIFHANPRNVEDPLGPERPEDQVQSLTAGTGAEVMAFGHVHIPYVRRVGDKTLFDIASVGLPRDGDRRAAYGIAEWAGGKWRLEHRRVPYDIDAVVADMRTCGMPNAEKNINILLSARY